MNAAESRTQIVPDVDSSQSNQLDSATDFVTGTDVPKDYESFVKHYYNKIRSQVAGFIGIQWDNVEDITQTIVMEFIAGPCDADGTPKHEGGYLHIFDKDRQREYAEYRYTQALDEFNEGHGPRPIKHEGKFSSFVYQFTKLRLLGKRDKLNRIQRYEGVSTDVTLDTEEGEESTSTLNAFIGRIDPAFQTIELRELLRETYSQLCLYTSPTETRDLPGLFQRIISEEFSNPAGFDKKLYASERNISVSAVSMQVKTLREYCLGFKLWDDIVNLIKRREREE